jgi:hypothetical protein
VVECLGSEIDTVRPDDSPHLRIDLDPTEVVGILERLEDPTPVTGGKIDLPPHPILEIKAKTMVSHYLNTSDVDYLRHRAMLGKRIDPDRFLFSPRSLPIDPQLIPVKAGPLPHKRQLRARQRALQYRKPIDPY